MCSDLPNNAKGGTRQQYHTGHSPRPPSINTRDYQLLDINLQDRLCGRKTITQFHPQFQTLGNAGTTV